jgi:hypothetical protein
MVMTFLPAVIETALLGRKSSLSGTVEKSFSHPC